MDRMIHRERRCRSVILVLAALLPLITAGSAAAEERHTAVIRCDGGGFVGNQKKGKQGTITLKPETEVRAENDESWTIEELRQLPDFRLERAAMRFTANTVNGLQLKYALACGETQSGAQCARAGRNLWDVTEPVTAWMDRKSGVFMSSAAPLYEQNAVGMQSVAPFSWRFMNAGLVGSHAV